MAHACLLPPPLTPTPLPPPSQRKNLLTSNGPVSYNFNDNTLLGKVPLSRISLPYKVVKLNKRHQTKYHDFNSFRVDKYLKKSRTKYFQKSRKNSKNAEENH